MKTRCLNSREPFWMDYGGRGISICERWLNSFEAFLADMGSKPPGATLERIDNDGNYTPVNCRWATRKEQANNRRSSRWVEFNGQRRTLAQWAEVVGIEAETLAYRIKAGWETARVFTQPLRPIKN